MQPAVESKFVSFLYPIINISNLKKYMFNKTKLRNLSENVRKAEKRGNPGPQRMNFSVSNIGLTNKIRRVSSYGLNNGIREDTHKKMCFFSGRTTKGVGRVNSPDH